MGWRIDSCFEKIEFQKAKDEQSCSNGDCSTLVDVRGWEEIILRFEGSNLQ